MLMHIGDRAKHSKNATNIDGVLWFASEIFPIIKEEIPLAEFYIVGSNPTKEV